MVFCSLRSKQSSRIIHSALIVCIGLSIVLFSACTMKPKGRATLHFDLGDLRRALETSSERQGVRIEQDLFSSDNPYSESLASQKFESFGDISILSFPAAPSASSPAPPTTLGQFKCFILNVMGPGIPSRETPDPNDLPFETRFAHAAQGAPTAYEGIISAPFTLALGAPGTVSIDVPAGAGRVVQVIGLRPVNNTPGDLVFDFCMGTSNLIPHGSGGGDGFFIVGQTFIPSAFGDLAVNISQDYFSRPTWYQEYKRIKGSGSCKAYKGNYYVASSVPVSSSERSGFALEVNVPFTMPFNQFKLEIEGGTTGSLVKAKFYVDVSGFSGSAPLHPTGASAVYTAAEEYSLSGGQPAQTVTFTFPLITSPVSQNSYLIVYGTNPFMLNGEGTPAGDFYHNGASWTSMSVGVQPYYTISRCY